MATAEITMHPHMAFDIIQRQAGTLTKAIMEGVMNSVDAGASACTVTATATEIVISDDGCGVTSRQAVNDCLLQLGHPHDESEKKVYGRFRMGRGQMWAFGRNTWRTGPFKLVFDIRVKGLAVDVQEKLKPAVGCRIAIELYAPLDQTALHSLKNDLQRGVAYCPVPVLFNGERVSTDPVTAKWTHQTPEASIRLDDSGTLKLYNLGVFVTSFEADRFGSGGAITTKVPLAVNYARNDVMNDCPVWQGIQRTLDSVIDRNAAADKAMTEPAKNALLKRVLRGVLVENAGKLKLFKLADGRQLTAAQLWRMAIRRPVTSVSNNDARGDRLLQMGRAVCVSRNHLETLECTPEDYLYAARRIHLGARGTRETMLTEVVFKPVYELWDDAEFKTELLDAKQYRPTERMWLDLLDRASGPIVAFVAGPDRTWQHYERTAKLRRKLLIGRSSVHIAWTDGESYVAFDRDWLARQHFDLQGITAAMQVLCHEYAHDNADCATDTHGVEFYTRQDGIMRACLPDCIRYGLSVLSNVFKKAKRERPKAVLMAQDWLVGLRDAAARMYADLSALCAAQADPDAESESPADVMEPELAGVGE
jgi:hypothetical protein